MMSNYVEWIRELEDVAKNPKASVAKAMKDTGRKAIGCFPVYTPEEIIYAAGYLPVGMWGGPTDLKLADQYLQNFCCSVMRANLEYGLKGDYGMLSAVVITSFCDSLKALCKNWPYAVKDVPVFGFAYPQNRIAASLEYLLDEYAFLIRRLEDLSGGTIAESALDESLAIYEEYRATSRELVAMVADYPITLNAKTRHALLKAAWFMDKKSYTVKLNAIIGELAQRPKEHLDGLNVVITGIMVDAEAYLDVLVQNNITIVGDDLARESRQFRTLTCAEGTALERMAHRYLAHKGCSLIYDDKKPRGPMLIDMVKELHADAVIWAQMKFCEPEEFDYPICKVELAEAGVKVLYIENDQQLDSSGQLSNRVQTFVEINKK